MSSLLNEINPAYLFRNVKNKDVSVNNPECSSVGREKKDIKMRVLIFSL